MVEYNPGIFILLITLLCNNEEEFFMIRRSGFGLLEIIIAMAIAAILGTVGLTVYNDQIVRSNQEATKQEMVSLMGDFGKFYTQKGSYATRDGKLPNNIINEIETWNKNNKHYKFDVYVKSSTASGYQSNTPDFYTMESNTQSVCIVAKPLDNTIMSGTGTIIVDDSGATTIGNKDTASSLCGNAIPNPFPEPTNDVNPKPTQSPPPPGPKGCEDPVYAYLHPSECPIPDCNNKDYYNAHKDICDKPGDCSQESYYVIHPQECKKPSPEPSTTPISPTCDIYNSWDANTEYQGKGEVVAWKEVIYRSVTWSSNEDPSTRYNHGDKTGEPWDKVADCQGKPTPTPSPSPSPSPSVSPTPTPTPEPDFPTPVPNKCDQFNGMTESTVAWFKGTNQCKIDPKTKRVDGNCQDTKVTGGCSGNCDRTVNFIIDGGNGANGNCSDCVTAFKITSPGYGQNGNGDRSTICNGTVANGNMHDVTIVAGPNIKNALLCNGNCDRATIIVHPKTPEGVVCNGNCHNIKVYVPKSWNVKTLSQICNGNCDGTVKAY